VYSAWNKAVARIRGDWVCFLGSDDRLADADALSRMAADLRHRPERVVYGVTHVLDDAGNMRGTMGEAWPETRAELSRRMSLPNPSTFYHRELFDVHGRFDARFKIAGDYEFLLRELADGEAFFVDTLVTIMGAGGLSQDPRNWPQSLREAARARRMNGFPATPDWRSYQLYEAYGYASLTRWLGSARADRTWARYHGLLRRVRSLASRVRR
jgi:glycosyltransferase involved in cell wall biosynthesis